MKKKYLNLTKFTLGLILGLWALSPGLSFAEIQMPEFQSQTICSRWPTVCTRLGADKQWVNSFSYFLDAWKEEGLLAEDFDYFYGMKEMEVESALKSMLRIVVPSTWIEGDIQCLVKWIVNSIAGDYQHSKFISRRNGDERAIGFMKELTHLSTDQENIIRKFVSQFNEGHINDQAATVFSILTRGAFENNISLSDLIDNVKKFTELKKGMAFYQSLSKEGLLDLVTGAKQLLNDRWANAYVEFLSSLSDSATEWSINQLYGGQYFPRSASEHWGFLYPDQAQDVDHKAIIAFKPNIGKEIKVEGRIIKIQQIEVSLLDKRGFTHVFNTNEGKFKYFFVSEPETYMTKTDYIRHLGGFFKNRKGFSACSLIFSTAIPSPN